MTYVEFKQNFLPEFLKIKSFAGKIKYASQYLTRIGSGTGRIVYDIDGEKVLKLAKNPKGVAQNEAEAGAGYYENNHHILAKIIDSYEDDSWLIAEKAKKVNEARIKQLTGIPSLNDLFYFLRNYEEVSNGKNKIFGQDLEMEKFFWENEFSYDLADFVANYNQKAGDMGRPSSYGEVIRNGQPTIVLTDYGLNDEVYDTYYKPKKDKYGLYELFQYADGNDDILSDLPPQDAVDTRQGMWGFMPYSVGDGPCVTNEEFISFVENTDKYPQTNILPSTPYILDEFHNIVNNLKEVLERVPDKKNFYNNLLELQDYLIRGKFWDREPLEEETVKLHEANTPGVKPMSLKRDYADIIVKSVAEKLGIGIPEFLGGGGYGFAYLINNNKVLKITTDVCEVDAGLKIQRAKPQALVAVYNIYKVIDRENDITTYALIEDHIANKPIDDFFKYVSILNEIQPEPNIYGNLLILLRKKKLDEYLELSQKILTENPTANINKADREKAYQFMMGLFEIKKELMQLQIKSDDYSNLENVGYKNNVLTYFDIGGCFNIMQEPQFPPENRIVLPEGEELLDESLSRENADKIANVVAQKYYNGTPKYVGEGVFGVAYDIGNNMILKVTGDRSEANENLMLIGKPLEHIAKPYKVFSIKPKSGETELYVIILQKLQTNPAEFKAIKDRMDFAFKRIMNIDYPDVVDYYVNGYSPGLDVDEEMVEKYFARNPKDADFFYGVVRIGREAKEYGIESMDYVNPTNLGYMPDGSLGFFDVGFGNYFFQADKQPEEIEVDEDGSALYSTENSYGQDNFPPYDNTADDSPLTDNNVPPLDEDLTYLHASDATKDEYVINERQKSYMPGSQSVEVKKKCRLGGLGNTSVACNQGDINNLNLKPITEDIDAKEIYGSYDKAIKTVLSGKRDVGFVELNINNIKSVEKKGLHVIPIRMTSRTTMMAIIYRDKAKAFRLYDIAKSHGGYLKDKNADEAREIGRLLGYMEASIEEYIRRKYGNKAPIMPDKSPDDFDDLAEANFDNFEKQIAIDNTTHGLDKELIRTYNDGIDVNPVYAVNGDEVRDNGFIEWVEGGNHWVDADLPENEQKYAKHIPPDELWVDDVHLSKPNDFEAILLHERVESFLIKHYGYTYDDAHDIANKIELVFREKTHDISDEEESQSIAALYFAAFKKNFKPKGGKKFKKDVTTNEGIADVAAEKQFGIQPQHQGFEDKFARDQEEDVVYTDPNSDLVIIRNPKKLDSIFGYARGVIDTEGNLYIEQRPTGIHYDMLYALNSLGLVEDEEDWDTKLPHNFVTVQRYLRSNKILLGESNFAMIPDKERPTLSKTWQNIPSYKEAVPVYQRFLDRAKQKTPIFEFINEPLQRYARQFERGGDDDNPMVESETETCENVKSTPEIQEYLQKFGSDEELLRSGGIPTDMLDRAAFGFDDSLNELMPNQLSVKWKDDFENVKWEIKKKGLTDADFAKNVNLDEPIDVSFDGKKFDIEDGHHRYYAAKVLNVPLKINLEIKANPISALGGNMGYDEFHRCIWKQAHEQTNEMLNEAQIMSLQDLPFKQEIEQAGGKIFSVGGAVRDEFLGKQSKDLDILITGVPFEQLEQILGKYGRVDAVGKSFGVLKFKPKGATEDIDIAIPRTETATGEGGHQGFDVKSDHALPIEKDLERRDFTINAIAKDSDGNIVDPFGGQEDLKNKIIRVVNPQAFSDDPLRMLRAIQFSSRFGFTIEPETMKMIQANASRVKEIAPERILTEFDKIIEKGNVTSGVELLMNSGLYEQIFGGKPKKISGLFAHVKTMGEFIYLLAQGTVQSPAEFYKANLKGDIPTYKEIKALETAFSGDVSNPIMARSIAHNMYLFSPESLNSQIIPDALKTAAQELSQGKYPKTVNELAVNGNDLGNLGLVGKAIGDMQKSLLLKVYADKVRNKKEDLLAMAKQDGNSLQEVKEVKPTDKIEYGCLMLFLDVPVWSKIISIISSDDVYNEPGYGIENEPHTTILYGFHDEVTSEDCFNLFKENMPMKPIKIGIKGISFFTGNPLFDVVKFDVESPELTELNEIMKQLPYTSKFSDYHPHITIAYVKPGEGKKYVKSFEKNRMLIGTELVYTWKGHKGNDGDKLMLDDKVEEGLADKAAERMFNMPNQSAQQDVQARGAVQAQEEQPIAMISGGPGDRKKTGIYENPRSLANFDANVRGIIDTEGDIFVAQKNGNFNHGKMGIAMDFMDTDSDAMYKHLTEYMLINRIQDTNAFGLADSSYDFASDEYDYDNLKIVTNFLQAAKRKNPQYDFYNEYYEQIMGKPITEHIELPREVEPTWNINGEKVGIPFFVEKYDIWNQGGYSEPSEASVLEFLQNNYEDFTHDENLKKELLWALTDRNILDENKSKSNYQQTKESLMKSKSIDIEMKEEILKYLAGGSTYHEGGHIHGLLIPKVNGKTFDGVSMGADKNGFFVYTHRARSKSHKTPDKIPQNEINFIESTG